MAIEGEIPVEALQSKSAVNTAASKKPFAFIERTWEVKNPTEEEVSVCVWLCDRYQQRSSLFSMTTGLCSREWR